MRPALGVVFCVSFLACRGDLSAQPPIHLVPDMDWQPRFGAEQAISKTLFADGRAMRPLVPDTVAQGHLNEDDAYYRGRADLTHYVAVAPVEMTAARLTRGQERFNIYCAPCHDQAGSGHGMVVQRGFPAPVDLASDRVRGLGDGEVFNVITHGVRNMPGYAAQVPVEDRWNIVGWVRVLGQSQHAALEDVPADQRARILPEGAKP